MSESSLSFDSSSSYIFHLSDYVNPGWICARSKGRIDYSTNQLINFLGLTVLGVLAGYGLTFLVQKTVSLQSRQALIKASHLFGGFFWIYLSTVCQTWTLIFVIFTTYLWGSEPYDNVFSNELWRVVKTLTREGEKVHFYWVTTSIFFHAWFVAGAAALSIGLGYPGWYWLAILGFCCSHLARVFAYGHHDTVASTLEVIGILFLVACFVFEVLEWTYPAGIWLTLSVAERVSHLPTALRGDASWMRSYELWLAAVERVKQIEARNAEKKGKNQPELEGEASLSSSSTATTDPESLESVSVE